jgi:hypothetical protein
VRGEQIRLGGLAAALAGGIGLVAGMPDLFHVRVPPSTGTRYSPSSIRFDREQAGAFDPLTLPQISHVQIIDCDGDGSMEVVACDALGRRILRFDRSADGSWRESTLIDNVGTPAHATFVDIDADGDLDCVVAILGDIFPSDAEIGRVELFRREADGFAREVLLDDIRRVADVQPADFDADGDIDLAVAVFGYSRGEILWLENLGDGTFGDHQLHDAAGGIHVPIGDYDGDGDPDIATVISQEDEEVWGFENLGGGQFTKHLLWRTANFDLGSAGLVRADLDGDGDEDLILPTGDNLEDFAAYPQPYHGCLWLENRGDWTFVSHRIADLGGTYAAATGDLDGDGDMDVVLVSMANEWSDPQNASLVWLENDGRQQFRTWQIAADPIHLVTVDVGDVDGDGKADVVAGSLNLRAPYERIGKVTAWINRGASQ